MAKSKRKDKEGENSLKELLELQPKQQEAWDSVWKYKYTLYGGARGGGKSYFLRKALLGMLLYYPSIGLNGVMVGLFCDTYDNLRDRHLNKIKTEFPSWLGELKRSDVFGLAFHLRDEYGGGILALRNLRGGGSQEEAASKYKSAEFAAVAWDEVTETGDIEVFNTLRGSLRWPGLAHCPFIGATNPDGPGNVWVRKLWIERDFPPELKPEAGKFNFVPAKPSDNEYLTDDYWSTLKSLPEDKRRAWIEGDWYVFSGQALKFRYDTHVVTPFEIPGYWTRKRGIDWGYANPMCCLWSATNPDNGRVVVYRELYEKELTDRQQARTIYEMTPANELIGTTYADPSMWTRRTQTENLTSTADVYRDNGIFLTPAQNNRLMGKRMIDRMLEPLPDGLPGLLVFESCKNLIRTLPGLVYDKTHTEDVNSSLEDHAYDALRYLLSNHRDVTAIEHRVRRVGATTNNPWYKVSDL